MKIKNLFMLSMFILLVTACSNKSDKDVEKQFVGSWVGSFQTYEDGIHANNNIEVTYNEDNTFEMTLVCESTDLGYDCWFKASYSGSWYANADKLIMEPDKSSIRLQFSDSFLYWSEMTVSEADRMVRNEMEGEDINDEFEIITISENVIKLKGEDGDIEFKRVGVKIDNQQGVSIANSVMNASKGNYDGLSEDFRKLSEMYAELPPIYWDLQFVPRYFPYEGGDTDAGFLTDVKVVDFVNDLNSGIKTAKLVYDMEYETGIEQKNAIATLVLENGVWKIDDFKFYSSYPSEAGMYSIKQNMKDVTSEVNQEITSRFDEIANNLKMGDECYGSDGELYNKLLQYCKKYNVLPDKRLS